MANQAKASVDNRRRLDLFDRQPPCNLEAEQNVLGSIMLQPLVMDDVVLIVREVDFYDTAHAELFRVLAGMHDDGKKLDPTVIIDELRREGVWEQIGGHGYFAEVVNSVPTAANAKYYAEIVRDKAILRRLIETGTEIVRSAYDATMKGRDLAPVAEQRFFEVADAGRRADESSSEMRDILLQAFEQIDARMEGNITGGVSSGFVEFDKLTGGFHDTELIIVAARPSMGKSAFAANVAEHAAIEDGKSILLVSLEMSSTELATRMLYGRAKVRGEKLRSGYLSGDDHQALIAASAELANANIIVDDRPDRDVLSIAALARRMKRSKKGLDMLIVDYLQLLQPHHDDRQKPRQEQVANMGRRLKILAKELHIPVLCVAQLNRQVEDTKGNRPRLHHLRESGAIEQDADVVLFVHREEYFATPEELEAMKTGANPRNIIGDATIIVAKQRAGPSQRDVPLYWFQEYTRFENAERRQYDEFESQQQFDHARASAGERQEDIPF